MPGASGLSVANRPDARPDVAAALKASIPASRRLTTSQWTTNRGQFTAVPWVYQGLPPSTLLLKYDKQNLIYDFANWTREVRQNP